MYKLLPFSYSFKKSGKTKKIFLEKPISLGKNEIVAIVGPSGGGKTTLLKILKGIIPEYSSGVLEGEVFFHDRPLHGIHFQENLKKILYLFQNPFSQLIYPTPEEEFLFSMENFNFTREEMTIQKEKFEELFNLKNVWGKKTSQLSNGECQKLVLASLLAINPEVLLLDEPTAFLDPEARAEFYEYLEKIKDERLVIIVDHHVDEIKGLVNRVIEVSSTGEIQEIKTLQETSNIPYGEFSISDIALPKFSDLKLQLSKASFFYSKKAGLLNDVNLEIKSGEIVAIKGKNGVGKSTLFKLISGIISPILGQVKLESGGKIFTNRKIFSNVGFIFQNPEAHFFFDTIEEELKQSFKNVHSQAIKDLLIHHFFHEIDLQKSPFLLSEGEKRRLSILMTVFLGKAVLLYDEPTFGQDENSINSIASLMLELKKLGLIQIFISHDGTFIKKVADKVFVLESGRTNEILRK
jgi:energy-coupling factor transporter ATP-binding protein EcfA2